MRKAKAGSHDIRPRSGPADAPGADTATRIAVRAIEYLVQRRVGDRVLIPDLPRDLQRRDADRIDARGVIGDPSGEVAVEIGARTNELRSAADLRDASADFCAGGDHDPVVGIHGLGHRSAEFSRRARRAGDVPPGRRARRMADRVARPLVERREICVARRSSSRSELPILTTGACTSSFLCSHSCFLMFQSLESP